MKRLNLFYGVVALSSLSAVAQVNQTPVHTGGGQIMVTAEKDLAAKGTVFLNENFMPAKVTGSDATVLARYNAYEDQFQLSNPQAQTVEALPKEEGVVITFVSTGDAYTSETYKTDDNETVDGFLKVISNGNKVKIYKRERIYLQQGKHSKNSYQAAKAPEYKRAVDEFYIKLNNATEASYFDGKKDFAKLIPGKEKEVLDYIKKNKIDTEKDEDLQKLASYVETLI